MDSLEQLLQFLEEEQNEFIFEVAITGEFSLPFSSLFR